MLHCCKTHFSLFRTFLFMATTQWEAAEEAIHQIVTHSDDEFSLTYEDLKKMLDWKDRLEELSVKCSTLVSYLHRCWCCWF